MSQKTHPIWLFALPASLVILVGAYYIKVPAARGFIDAHTTLGNKLFGRFVHDTVIIEHENEPEKEVDPMVRINAQLNPTPGPTPRRVFDLQELARDPAHWPKKVTLKKPAAFPAVVGGKVVGSLTAPAGSEANLKMIKDGKIGLEYQGGGTFVAVEDTDLAARVMAQ